MKNLLFSLLFLSFSNLCFSQTSIGIKLTPQIQFNEAEGEVNEGFISNNPFSFGAAITLNQYVKNHRFSVGSGINRFEDKFSFQSKSSNSSSKITTGGINYVLFFPLSYTYFLKNKESNYRPFLGVGSTIYYQSKDIRTY